MNSATRTPHTRTTKPHRGRWVALIAGTTLLGAAVLCANHVRQSTADRAGAYTAAVERIAAKKDWPQTPEALIRQFWDAVAKKDIDAACTFCPGSLRSDFAMYEKWTPQPAKAIGAPEAHPQKPGLTLYPVTVSFPHHPKKTVKMAVVKAADGRLVIDGQNTIWW